MSQADPEKGAYRTTKFRLERDLFVAICGAGLFLAYLWKSKFPQIYQLSAVIFLGLYIFYRWLHIGLLKNKLKYFIEVLIPLVFTIILFISLKDLPFQFYLSILIGCILASVYNLRIGHFRLRNLPYLKSLLISFLWVFILVLLPEYLSKSSDRVLLVSGLENFVFILAMTIMYDIYDIYEDEQYGMKTLVNYRLNSYAEGIVCGLLLLSNLPGLFLYLTDSYSLTSICIQLIISIIAIIMVLVFRRRKTILLLVSWDGLILIKAVMIILLS